MYVPICTVAAGIMLLILDVGTAAKIGVSTLTD
jgi:hypothetical protein